jgi:hypothetical protein
MKKIMFTLAAMLIAVSASAQVYVGGTAGIASVKNAANDNETTYKFLPEIGYHLNNDWAIGVSFGWQKGTFDLVNNADPTVSGSLGQGCMINPYVRYTFVHSKYVDVFTDLGLDYAHINHTGDYYGVGFKPGLAVNLSKSISFITKIGFIGYQAFDPKSGDNSNQWGVELNGNNIQFGVVYNF